MAKATQKKKEKKNITAGVAHVNSTFNNTRITITDAQGNTVAWSTAGAQGFKGSRKSYRKRYENFGSRSQGSGFGQRIRNQSFAGCRFYHYHHP